MRTTLDKDRTLEDLRGSFKYGGILAGVVDVLVGVLVTFHFMEGADLNNGQSQIILILIGLICSVIAFFCGAKFRADKNKDQLVDNAQALVNTYKAAAEKTESDRNGEIARLSELHQHEVQDLKATHHKELNEKEHEITRLTSELAAAKSVTMDEVISVAAEASKQALSPAQPVESLTDEDIAEIIDEMVDKRADEMDSELERQVGAIQELNSREALTLELILDSEEMGKVYTTWQRDAALNSVMQIGIVRIKAQDRSPFEFSLEKVYECTTTLEWRRALKESRGLIHERAAVARKEEERRERERQQTEAKRRREELRQTAREVSPDNKLLLLYLADRGTLNVAIGEYKLDEHLGSARTLITYAKIDWDRFSLELSDEGASVVTVARDILQRAASVESYIWWDADADPAWSATLERAEEVAG